MNISMTEAQRSKDENKRISAFSKLWNKGETWMVFYPLATFGDDSRVDVVVNATYGNRVNDFEGLGIKRTFIPFNGEVVDGRPKSGSLANDFARLSRAILKGEEQKAIEKLQTNKLLAKDPEAMAQKIAKIKDDYSKNKRPALGGFTKVITTECVGVKLNGEGVPDPKTAALASQELSGGRVAKLQRILTSPLTKFTADDKYLVVTYAFGVQERKQDAGDVDPAGVKPEDRPETKYPEIWAQMKPVLDSMASDSDMIAKRNSVFTPLDDDVLLGALKTYIIDSIDNIEAVKDTDSIKILESSKNTLRLLGVTELPNVDLSIDEEKEKQAEEEAMEEEVVAADEAQAKTDESEVGEFEIDSDLAAVMSASLGV